jgi:hypothetical protein
MVDVSLVMGSIIKFKKKMDGPPVYQALII